MKAHLSSFETVKILVIYLYLELRKLTYYKWSQIDLPNTPKWPCSWLSVHLFPAFHVCSSLAVIFLGFTKCIRLYVSSAFSSPQSVIDYPDLQLHHHPRFPTKPQQQSSTKARYDEHSGQELAITEGCHPSLAAFPIYLQTFKSLNSSAQTSSVFPNEGQNKCRKKKVMSSIK